MAGVVLVAPALAVLEGAAVQWQAEPGISVIQLLRSAFIEPRWEPGSYSSVALALVFLMAAVASSPRFMSGVAIRERYRAGGIGFLAYMSFALATFSVSVLVLAFLVYISASAPGFLWTSPGVHAVLLFGALAAIGLLVRSREGKLLQSLRLKKRAFLIVALAPLIAMPVWLLDLSTLHNEALLRQLASTRDISLRTQLAKNLFDLQPFRYRSAMILAETLSASALHKASAPPGPSRINDAEYAWQYAQQLNPFEFEAYLAEASFQRSLACEASG